MDQVWQRPSNPLAALADHGHVAPGAGMVGADDTGHSILTEDTAQAQLTQADGAIVARPTSTSLSDHAAGTAGALSIGYDDTDAVARGGPTANKTTAQAAIDALDGAVKALPAGGGLDFAIANTTIPGFGTNTAQVVAGHPHIGDIPVAAWCLAGGGATGKCIAFHTGLGIAAGFGYEGESLQGVGFVAGGVTVNAANNVTPGGAGTKCGFLLAFSS
jgi:hypothetical protein